MITLETEQGREELGYEEFEQRLARGVIPPTTRIRFPAVTGDRFVPIRELELYEAGRSADPLRYRLHLSERGIPVVTAILVGLQIRIYLWSKVPGGSTWLVERTGNWAPAVLEHGEIHRLLTYGMLHVSLTHLAFNALFLAYTGWNLERALGRLNLLVLYAISVVSGGLLSLAMSPDRYSLGASAGDFGLIAASVVFGWKYGELVPARARRYFGWAILPYLVGTLISGFTSGGGVDNWGHLGGVAGGVLGATLLHPQGLGRYRQHNRRIRVTAVAVILGIMAVLGYGGPRLVPLQEDAVDGVSASRPSYWVEGWTFTGDRGWFSPTRSAISVLATSVHPTRLDPAEATRRFLHQVSSEESEVEILEQEQVEIQGIAATRLLLRFELSGTPHRMRALLIFRGRYLHRLHQHAIESRSRAYDVLWERTVADLVIEAPRELREARDRLAANPRSWRAACSLGTALARAGRPEEAERAFQRAMNSAPDRALPRVEHLRLIAEYGLAGAQDALRSALAAFPSHPQVALAAARLLHARGGTERARELLKRVMEQHPQHADLRAALEDLPPQEPPSD